MRRVIHQLFEATDSPFANTTLTPAHFIPLIEAAAIAKVY